MDSSWMPPKEAKKSTWSPSYLIEQQPEIQKRNTGYIARFFDWWYSVAVPTSLGEQASLRTRELFRRARLNSNILLLLLLFIIALLAVMLPHKNLILLVTLLVAATSSFLALALNARRQVTAASLMTISITIAVPVVLSLSSISGIINLLILSFLCLPELLAATLLSPGSVFFLAIINSAIAISVVTITSLPHAMMQVGTPVIELALYFALFYTSIATAIYLLTRSTNLAVVRADRAEVVAILEHAMAEREHTIARQKRDLDLGIQYILQTHLQVANGDYDARVPFLKENVLWPIAGSLNTILARLQRLQKQADELEQTKQEAARLAAALHATRTGQQPLQFRRTGTAIDLISLELSTDVSTVEQHQKKTVEDTFSL